MAMRIQIVWAVIIVGTWVAFLFGSPLDPDYTSGELLDHVLGWSQGEALYAELTTGVYRVLNYPPLFLALVKFLGEFGVPYQLGGRILNLLAFAVCLVVLYRWSREQGCQKITALFVLALTATAYPIMYSLGQFHLQLSAVALSLVGLYWIRNPQRHSHILLGGIFLGLACFMKQTQVIALIIGMLWLLLCHRRYFLSGLVGTLLVGLGGAALLHWQFGMAVWHHMITYTVGTYSGAQLLVQFGSHLVPAILFFVIALYLGSKNQREARDLRWWYLIGTSLWLLSSARVGASFQYFTGWSFALLLFLAPYFERWRSMSRSIVVLLAIQIIGADIGVAYALGYDIRALHILKQEIPNICRSIPVDASRIPSEFPGLPIACGKRPALHPFIMSSLSLQDLWSQDNFVKDLSAGRYPILLFPYDLETVSIGHAGQRWTPEMMRAMRDNYAKTHEFGAWSVYSPVDN